MTRYYEYEEHEHVRAPRRDRSPSPSASGAGRHSPRASRDSFVRETMTLEPPPGVVARGRSQPPPDTREVVPRGRGGSGYYDDDYYDEDDDDYYAGGSRGRGLSPSRSRSGRRRSGSRGDSPLSRARSTMQDNFTNSTAGIGASLIGAIAGGFAARQVSDRVSDNRRAKSSHGAGSARRRRSDADKEERMRLASTLLGAAIGGLGANALTNRFEDTKDKDRLKQHAWERQYGREDDLPHYDTGRPGDLGHRNGRGIKGRDDYDDDDDYDQVYDPRYDDERRRPRRQDSDEGYRYRN